MDKRRLRITLNVLNKVKYQFPETIEFIDERLEQACLKERGNFPITSSMEEVIFLFTCLDAKMHIYLHVVWI